MMKKIVLITGGFDPIHSGHLAYIQAAKALGDILVVGVNSDAWLDQKKGRAFMPLRERTAILRAIAGVNYVIDFDDSDGTAKNAIRMCQQSYPQDEIIFANGGDRTAENIPEMDIVNDNIKFVFGVGGNDKKNSSSWMLEDWKSPTIQRPWGHYRVIYEVPGTRVKELTIEPGQSISLQRHQHRAEYWHISEGEVVVDARMPNGYVIPPRVLKKHQSHCMPQGEWHRLMNLSERPCKIVEIQFGDHCLEDDIERRDP
jgi:cytidyltransferase-like protein